MRANSALIEGAERLAERVRAAQLPSPGERARIRRAARATLRDFAGALGVAPMTVHRWEVGEVDPRLDQAAAYARLLAEVAAATAPVREDGAA
jgi:DNA-binding XRE family transcriptional regulator